MRQLISRIMFIGGLITWLVLAGVLIAQRAEWLVWAVWALSLPALYVVVALIAIGGPKKTVPDETKVLNTIHINNPVERPQYGEMKEDI